jgi:hypothetical protein
MINLLITGPCNFYNTTVIRESIIDFMIENYNIQTISTGDNYGTDKTVTELCSTLNDIKFTKIYKNISKYPKTTVNTYYYYELVKNNNNLLLFNNNNLYCQNIIYYAEKFNLKITKIKISN